MNRRVRALAWVLIVLAIGLAATTLRGQQPETQVAVSGAQLERIAATVDALVTAIRDRDEEIRALKARNSAMGCI